MNSFARICLAAALAAAVHAHAGAQAVVRRCTIDGEAARCGSVAVPENHAEPQGRQLALGLLVLSGDDPGPRGEPIFVLAGGPGQAATSMHGWAATVFQGMRCTRDVVLIDQRGTGEPSRLDCPRAPGTLAVPEDPERCIARLSENAALQLYGTESVVEDLERVRQALGYERIVLYGASYGTRAAYAYARRYPGNVRAAVLVAPAPVSMPLLDSWAEDGSRSLDAIVADCLADRPCSRAFPQLRADLGRFHAAAADPSRIIGLQLLQYSAATAVHVPRLLHQAAAGTLTPLDSAIAAVREGFAAQIALGAHLSIVCAEDLPFGTAESASAVRLEYARACERWPRSVPSPGFHEPERLQVPALVLVGEWDPVTSPRWARVAAEQFSPSQLITLPRTGHLLVGYDLCLASLIEGFLERGAADPSCVSAVRRPPYVLR